MASNKNEGSRCLRNRDVIITAVPTTVIRRVHRGYNDDEWQGLGTENDSGDNYGDDKGDDTMLLLLLLLLLLQLLPLI